MSKLLLIIIVFLFNYNSISFANFDVNARTAIVIDYHSDKVLYEVDADIQIYPASMTKIMTTIVAFDLIKKNKLSLEDKFVHRCNINNRTQIMKKLENKLNQEAEISDKLDIWIRQL